MSGPPDQVGVIAAGGVESATKDRFIETWRGLSIFLVLAFHYTNRVDPAALGSAVPPSIQFYSGKLGVYIFFVISGYLISMTLGASRSLGEFYAKRLSRLWPLFILASLVIFSFMQVFEPPRVMPGEGARTFNTQVVTVSDLIATLFFLPQLGFRWVDGVFWSILVEIKFYLFIGIFTALFGRNNVRNFAIATVVLGGIEFALYLFAGAGDYVFANKLLHGFLIAQYLPFFAIGMLLQRNMFGGLFNACLLLVLIQCVIAVAANPELDVYRTLVFLFCLTGLLAIDYALLGGAIFFWWGKYSFSIYLFHQMIGLTFIAMWTPALGIDLAIVAGTLVVLVIAVLGSWLAEWRFRRPVTRWLIRLFALVGLDRVRLDGQPGPTPAPAPAPRVLAPERG